MYAEFIQYICFCLFEIHFDLHYDCWAEFTEDHSAAAERVLYRGRETIISEMQKYTQ